MDFGVLPPEVNSGRMYAGPGAAPMLAAAGAWDGLAAELHNMAAAYRAAVIELAVRWHGPSAAAMAAAATPYADWLHATAAQAEQTAAAGRAAAAAYEAAFAATVPPPMIAANRSLLMSLIATNILGQNTLAIAATEAHYAEMWAQDATAMYGYAAASALAARLMPFGQPPPTTNAAGLTDQSTATAHAVATSAPRAAADSTSGIQGSLGDFTSAIGDVFGPYSPLGHAGIAGGWFLTGSNTLGLAQNVPGVVSLMSAPKPVTGVLAPLSGQLISAPALSPAGPVSSLGSPVSATASRAGMVGGLSVPPAWAATAPAIGTAATAAPTTAAVATAAAASAITTPAQAGLLGGGMGLSGLAGRAISAGTTQQAVAAATRTIGTAAPSIGAVAIEGIEGIDNTVTILVIPPPPE